jgi:hypothetical protein
MIAARDGDLARVTELLAANPGHKAAKLDLANKYGWRAIHFAAKNGNVEILNALAAAGADINITTKNTSTPLGIAIFYEKTPVVQRLVELGADVNIGGPKSKPLGLAFGMIELHDRNYKILWDIAISLVQANIDVEHLNYVANNLIFNAHVVDRILIELDLPGLRFRNPVPPAAKVLELVSLLIEKYPADIVNHINQVGGTWVHGGAIMRFFPDILAQRISVASMRLLLDNGIRLVHPGNLFIPRTPDNQNPILKAHAGLYSPEMNALITERFPAPANVAVAPAPAPAAAPVPAQPPKMWKGWTRGDLGKFDIIFDEHSAINYSICPFCFKLTERQDGCMYMYHNCLEEQRAKGGYVHKELYEKYKMRNQLNPALNNMVWWCTVCGRPCKSHVHYNLLPPFVAYPTVVEMDPGANPFGNDCRGANKGGGIPEKIARFRRAREYALELQGQIDQITEDEAMKQLIEEMWIAPIARYERRVEKIKQEGRYNIPNTNFPPNVAPAVNVPANNAPAPNLLQPQANRNDPALRPELIEAPGLEDELMLEEDIGRGVKFHHRRPDGTMYHHEKPLGRVGFEAWFDGMGMARNFGHQRFGRCYWPDCNAVWYPQEIEPFVDTAEEEKFLPRELFEIYKRNFNRHMPAKLAAIPAAGVAPGAAQGGYNKRIQKTRKVKGAKRKQRGGQPHNMFLELETAQCLLPRKNKANTGGARKRHRKTKRKTRR